MQMQNYLINYATAFTKNFKIKSKNTFFFQALASRKNKCVDKNIGYN